MEKKEIGLIDLPITRIEEDGLGIEPYVTSLTKLIKDCATPMTISIQGGWGSGKTSFMKLIKNNLETLENRIKTVEFNTWQYSKFNLDDILAVSFLEKFANAIVGEGDSEQKTKIKKVIKSLTFSTLGVLTNGIVSPSFEHILSDEPVLSTADQVSELKEQLELSVSNKIKNKEYERIVVFVDDLDRLHPSKAVELLEVLQLFFTIENCVFVLAVDYDVVIQGIKNKYGHEYSDLKAKNFFDKIIQLPFNIPIGSSKEVKGYVGRILNSIQGLDVNEDQSEQYVSIINTSVQFNPRSIKRIVNAYWLLRLVIEEKEEIDNINDIDLALFTILCMQLAYEPVYVAMMKILFEEELLAELLHEEVETEDFIKGLDIESEVESKELMLSDFHLFFFEFKNIFTSENGFDLLKYVMNLSKSTSSENINTNNTIHSVVIRSKNILDEKKLKRILNDEFSEIIEKIEIMNEGMTAVVKFKELTDKSYRFKIKQKLLEGNIEHYIVTSHKYNYYGI